MATSQQTRSNITLRGSTEIVTEFFGFSINNILYQRGIYPPELFKPVNKYGLTLLVASDEGLRRYLSQVLTQISEWLMNRCIQKLVIVIASVTTQQVLERWVFNIEADRSFSDARPAQKPEREIQSEIQAIMRQITSSVSCLPLLREACTFDLLVYTDESCEIPHAWEVSDPKYISNSAEVRLRSFTTKVHKVDACVAYRRTDDDL
ncbi:putative Mitotic spindle checkpoint protein MAD2 [Paratrimastix pyriformis]|uniref:Mitotic spindle checkpoint protein MAD2 n=1 Tax=Paratrimastix pyriformis TaxID=342808 RepID=A0ABQ8UNT7_9EUKA|nr:putative Mitotic spindle checkpoint protein MAD2 [Paratrimastix pyriformis]